MMYFKQFRDFEDGTTVTALGYDIVLRRRSIGNLLLPTGSLIACDPLTYLETEPFDLSVPPGSYPVSLVIAELRDEYRVAYAVLRIGDAEVARWDIATVPGEHVSVLDEIGGYPVESSLGCFMDATAADALLDYAHVVLPEDDEFTRISRKETRKTRRRKGYGWSALELRRDLKLPVLEGLNVAIFETGYGEGVYTTYAGRDEDGNIVQVVTDFEVLDFRFNTFGLLRRLES